MNWTAPSPFAKPALKSAGLGAALSVLCALLQWADVWSALDRPWFDLLQSRFDTRMPAVPENCALVDIDASTINTHGEGKWPFARLAYATALQALHPQSPRGVAFEMLLAERDAAYSVFDGAFALQVRRFPFALFAASVLKLGEPVELPDNLEPIPMAKDQLSRLTDYSTALLPLERFTSGAALGFNNLPTDSDGIIRSIPLAFRYLGQAYPSFVLRAIMSYEDLRPSDVQIENDGHVTLRKRGVIIHRIPVDRACRLLLRNRQGRPTPPRVGLDTLVLAAQQQEHGKKNLAWDLSQFRDRFVFVSRQDPRTYQGVLTAQQGTVPPMNIHLAAWQSIFAKDFIEPVNPWALLLGCALSGAFVSWFACRFRAAWFLLPLLFVGVDAFALSAWLFSEFGLLLSVVAPLLSALLGMCTGLFFRKGVLAPVTQRVSLASSPVPTVQTVPQVVSVPQATPRPVSEAVKETQLIVLPPAVEKAPRKHPVARLVKSEGVKTVAAPRKAES